MTSNKPHADFGPRPTAMDPFRRAILRGLAILLPPLLTIVIFLWVGNTVNSYLLEPLVRAARWVMVEELADVRSADSLPAGQIVDDVAVIDGEKYHLTGDDKLIPLGVYESVRDPAKLGKDPMPVQARRIYERYVNQTWLRPELVVPVFVSVFLLLLYLLGKFMAAGVGR